MSQALHPMLNVAIKAARTAGTLISRASMDIDLVKVSSKGANDFVTEVDQAAEAAIIDTLLAAYPGHGILAEETGRTRGAKDSEYLWIIDPLDGTTNFIHGFPHYNVSIGLAVRGKLEQAVVYDPNRNDLYYASKGRGAFLNDKRLRVSKRTRLADSLVGTGFPFRKGDNFKRYMRMFEDVSQACAGIRRPGAAALDLCYVAAGYLDGFFETGLSPWDVAAGSLMITEAGGLVGNFTGESDFLYQRELVAGNPRVYAQLVTMLSPYTKMIEGTESASETGEPIAQTGRTAGGPALGRTTIGANKGGSRSTRESTDDEPRSTAPDATSIFARSTVGLNDATTEPVAEQREEPAAPRKPPTRIKKADFVATEPEAKPQNRR